jgi:hypothetical protein
MLSDAGGAGVLCMAFAGDGRLLMGLASGRVQVVRFRKGSHL